MKSHRKIINLTKFQFCKKWDHNKNLPYSQNSNWKHRLGYWNASKHKPLYKTNYLTILIGVSASPKVVYISTTSCTPTPILETFLPGNFIMGGEGLTRWMFRLHVGRCKVIILVLLYVNYTVCSLYWGVSCIHLSLYHQAHFSHLFMS